MDALHAVDALDGVVAQEGVGLQRRRRKRRGKKEKRERQRKGRERESEKNGMNVIEITLNVQRGRQKRGRLIKRKTKESDRV